MPILPDEIIIHIKSFLIKCQNCNSYFDEKSSNICVSCKKAWCIHCCKICPKYIGFYYHQLFIMTCHKCLIEYRLPSINTYDFSGDY